MSSRFFSKFSSLTLFLFFSLINDLQSTIEYRDHYSNPYRQYENIRYKIDIITNERNILKKFIYQKLINIINDLTKKERFSESLEAIKVLENNFSIDQIDFYDYGHVTTRDQPPKPDGPSPKPDPCP